MNPEIMKQAGFKAAVELAKNKKCPFCKADMKKAKFRDIFSVKEFIISGLCQDCQDKMFGI